MTARLFIIRGSFIIAWFFYGFMGDFLIDQRASLRPNFILFFGLVSLGLGLVLFLTKENLLKLEISLLFSLIGLTLGISTIGESWFALRRVLKNDFYFSLKAASSLFFGLLIIFLYARSLGELSGKISKRE